MPAVGGGGVPSLSQIRQWDTEHLEAASRSWSAIGETWEDSFNSSYRGVAQPAGTSWEGEAAEAAAARSYEDLIKARGLADTLHEAASVARSGAGELEYAKRRVLYAVQDAEAAGFTVGEDLSLTSRETFTSGAAMAAKQLQAETLAAEIRTRAAALSALDVAVAGKITTAMAPLGAVDFAETPPGEGDRDGSVQAVDHRTFKEGPDLSPTPEPDGAGGGEGEGGPQPLPRHPDYPNRTTDGKYGEGNSRDGKWEEKVALDKYEEATGVPVIRDQVRATHPDVQNPKTGNPQGRFYDGLQPTGNPGEYIGIEAKGDGVSVPGDQARFDAAVTPENPATAILNGEEIKIVGTEVAYPRLENGPPPPAVPQPPQGGAPTALPTPVEGSAGVPDVPTTSATGGGGGGGGSWGGETSWPDMMSMPHEQLVKLAESGDPLGNIAKMILQSPEYQAKHPPPTA